MYSAYSSEIGLQEEEEAIQGSEIGLLQEDNLTAECVELDQDSIRASVNSLTDLENAVLHSVYN